MDDWVNKVLGTNQANFINQIKQFTSIEKLVQIESAIEMGAEITISDGIIRNNDGLIRPCIITTYQSQDLKSLKFLLKDQLYAYKKIFKGYLLAIDFEKSSENYTISLFTKKYEKTLNECQDNKSEDEKLELLLKIAKVLHKLSRFQMFYGKINPEGICITEDNCIVFKYIHWILLVENFRNHFPYTFIESEFLSPELIILREYPFDRIERIFEPSSAYAFGLLFLRCFNCELPNIMFMMKGQVALNYIFGTEFRKIIVIIFSQEAFNTMKQSPVIGLIDGCFEPVIKRRLDLSQIIDQIKFFKQQNEENTTTTLNQSMLTTINSQTVILTKISKKLYSCHKALLISIDNDSLKKFVYWTKTEKNLLLELEQSKNFYFSSPCKAEKIPVEAGILTFFYFLFKDIDRESDLYSQLVLALSKIDSAPQYNSLFSDIIKSRHEHIKDLLISEMIIQTFTKDWAFLFPIKYQDFPTLKPCQKLTLKKKFFVEVKNFFNEDLITGILMQFSKNNLSIKNQILEGLDRTYITKLIPSLNGLTTYNLNIFIKDYQTDIKTEMNDAVKGAILITLFHELSHFLRRNDSRTLSESRSRYTSKNNSNFEELNVDNKIEWEIFESRDESGEKSELELFGKTLRSINVYAGAFLLQGNFSSIEEFRAIFFKENKKGGLSVSMTKGSSDLVVFKGLCCGVSRKIHS
ncbi:hypothetical protein SteCoe_20204 [Stentor coeruleus]|uniref:Protein kinase domain-containing protein n=1 Tax=Stentor coeruleus TaxID=5963 RepID=A0A1R2BT13_9CILI|nr:hypothetical protein SteCoe_20204 [Stentor coeruleus]